MRRQTILAVAIAAGLLGGLLSRYVSPPAAFAQAQPAVPNMVRAQSIALTDDRGNTVGIFTSVVQRDGKRAIVLLDQSGNTIWSAGASPLKPLLSQR